MDKQDQILEKLDKLDSIETFLQKNMVTKEEFSELSGKVNTLTESVNQLTTAVANLAKQVHDYGQEHSAMKHQLLMMQDWIRKASEKIGIEFKL